LVRLKREVEEGDGVGGGLIVDAGEWEVFDVGDFLGDLVDGGGGVAGEVFRFEVAVFANAEPWGVGFQHEVVEGAVADDFFDGFAAEQEGVDGDAPMVVEDAGEVGAAGEHVHLDAAGVVGFEELDGVVGGVTAVDNEGQVEIVGEGDHVAEEAALFDLAGGIGDPVVIEASLPDGHEVGAVGADAVEVGVDLVVAEVVDVAGVEASGGEDEAGVGVDELESGVEVCRVGAGGDHGVELGLARGDDVVAVRVVVGLRQVAVGIDHAVIWGGKVL
jgi:hypothetical protein